MLISGKRTISKGKFHWSTISDIIGTTPPTTMKQKASNSKKHGEFKNVISRKRAISPYLPSSKYLLILKI